MSTDCASALIFGLIVSTHCASVIFLGHLVSRDCECFLCKFFGQENALLLSFTLFACLVQLQLSVRDGNSG